jgi:hypothetical protein
VTRYGRTPVVVRFAPGASTTRVAGLRLDPSSARSAGRSTQVDGSYGPRFAGFSARDLRGIASVRLDAPRPRSTARPTPAARAGTPAVPTHTVRIHVARANGSPTDYALVTLADTIDGSAYLEQADAGPQGNATFADVPEGEYSVVTQTFQKLVVDRQVEVAADATVEVDLGQATVRPQVSLPGRRLKWASLTVERDPEEGFGIPFGLSGPRFSMRVRPSAGKVRHGALHTAVAATFSTSRPPGHGTFAITDDVRRGIPDDLTFAHHRRDFARFTDLFYGNGPAAKRELMLFPGNARVELGPVDTDLQVPVPGRLRIWVQAGHGSYLQQTVFPLADADLGDDNTQIGDIRRFSRARVLPPVSFLHAPVGPGLELPPHARATSGAQRRGDTLQLFVPIMGGSGGPTFDFADPKDAAWSLREGRHVLARGHQLIGRVVHVAHGPRTFHLSAATHPGRAWDLSTHVSDEWTFHSRAGQSAVPLLTPSYVPPTDLAGNLGPGHTGYRLSFHSAPHSARVAQVTVQLSTDDGHSWRPARVTRTSGLTFHVGYANPAARGDRRYFSIRVTARDVHGNSVEETALHAYRLR